MLEHISIILVDTKTPANIGAVARAMMNTGLSRLALVNPPNDRDQKAARLAAGADDVLKSAAVCSSLAEAIAGHGLVVGASRHRGRRRTNVSTPREMAARIIPLLDRNRVAIVFGNEVNGLGNDELALCHELVTIPSSEAFASLNLSHAVMVVAYELFVASHISPSDAPVELAPAEEVEDFYAHLRNTLHAVDFLDKENEERMMFSLRQMFGRARLRGRDVRILRGILGTIEKTGRNIT